MWRPSWRSQDGHQSSAITRHLRWVISSPPVRRHKTTSHKMDTSHVDWSQALPRSGVVLLARRLDIRGGHVLRLSFTLKSENIQATSRSRIEVIRSGNRVAGLDLYRQPCPDAFHMLQKHSPTPTSPVGMVQPPFQPLDAGSDAAAKNKAPQPGEVCSFLTSFYGPMRALRETS